MDSPVDTSLRLQDFDATDAPGDERRREPRAACSRPIAILPYCEDRFLHGRFVDCSVHGVGLIVPQPLAVDENFLLKLRGESLTLLVYVIRNCRPADGSFRIGGELCGCIGTAANVGDRAILTMLLGGHRIECI